MNTTKNLAGLLSLLVSLAPVAAQRSGGARDAAAKSEVTALAVFEKQSVRDQKRILTEVRAAVGAIEGEYLQSVRKAAESRDVPNKKLKTRQKRYKSSGVGSIWSGQPFPIRVEYAFGFRSTHDVEPTKTRLTPAKRAAAARRAELAAMLNGYLPDLDLALASLLRELDHDRGADALSQLFESWRNGDESFYHALDRTAGTDDSIFFYDAMLDDFLLRCVPKKHPDYKKLRRRLEDAHDALHSAFLAYRQYRAFREAVALSLLLPDGALLPPSLRRYEESGGGQFSIRQQVQMLLLANKQDVAAVVAAVRETARPLPETLWGNSYDPFVAFTALVDSKKPELIRLAKHTDQALAQQVETRRALQENVAATARDALSASLGAKPH